MGLGEMVLWANLGTEPLTTDPALATDTTSVTIIEQMSWGSPTWPRWT